MSESETNLDSEEGHPWGTFALGLVLILLGGAIVYFAQQIRAFSLGSEDPGPKAIPIATGVLLFFGGILQVVQAIAVERVFSNSRSSNERDETTSGHSRWRILGTLLIMGVYVIGLEMVGFLLGTIVFLVIVLKLFGSGWKEALVSTLAIVAFVHLLFEVVFKVSLPTSSLF